MIEDTLPVGASVPTSTYYACLPACRCLHVFAQARPMMTFIALVIIFLPLSFHIIAERISARQYKSGFILGIYVRTYVRSSAQARTSRRSLRRRRRLDVYARARLQYRQGAYRKLGACETRFIAFATLNATL